MLYVETSKPDVLCDDVDQSRIELDRCLIIYLFSLFLSSRSSMYPTISLGTIEDSAQAQPPSPLPPYVGQKSQFFLPRYLS